MREIPRSRGHPISPPIAWVGGKRSILTDVLHRFPLAYDRYIEVFGGSGVTLFGKEASGFEVWNDYNNDLYNFFYCVKHKHLQLLRELRLLPLCSRAEFVLLRAFLTGEPLPDIDLAAEGEMIDRHLLEPESAELKEILTTRCILGDVSRATAFFKLNRMSYGAGMTSFSGQPCDLRRFYHHVSAAHNRLCGVILENKDFQSLIEQYDRPGSFFYLDPPYYMAESVYAVEFSESDHQRLFETLTGIEGRWLLSYNDCAFVRELYKAYPQYRFTRLSNLVQRYEGGAEYGEILIANYDMDERGQQNEQLKLTFE